MYLKGLGSAITIGGQVYSSITPELGNALKSGLPVYVDGRPASVAEFLGGFLVNGCPLNVIFGQGWISGQQDALRAAGLTQCLPAEAPAAQTTTLTTRPVSISTSLVPIPSPVVVTAPIPAGDAGDTPAPDWSQYLPYAALGVLALVLVMGGGRGKRG